MPLRVHLLPHCFCMTHATCPFYIGLKTIGTLFQFLHYLSIGTTIQFHHKHHRNTDDSSNEPRSPVPTTTIQNKPQNLKTQIKPEQPEDLKGELKVTFTVLPSITTAASEDLKGELKEVKGAGAVSADVINARISKEN